MLASRSDDTTVLSRAERMKVSCSDHSRGPGLVGRAAGAGKRSTDSDANFTTVVGSVRELAIVLRPMISLNETEEDCRRAEGG